jgi:3-hydroxy-9,10-secoandrosta-1,3,5(10)-triene-9,17-dione monooxygenase reductase component
LDDAGPLGWGLLIRATVEHVEVNEEQAAPLVHYRGRYLGGSPRR